jgi:hypothetical protein
VYLLDSPEKPFVVFIPEKRRASLTGPGRIDVLAWVRSGITVLLCEILKRGSKLPRHLPLC